MTQHMRRNWILPLAAALILLNGCSENSSEQVEKAVTPATPVAAKTPDTATQVSTVSRSTNPQENRGSVVSVQVAGSYSYLEVDVQGEKFWMATAISSAKPGDRIAWQDYAVMNNFSSKALGRTFDQILFVDRVVAEASLVQSQHQGTVIETLNAAGYSYIHVRENGNTVWLAAPQTPLTVGKDIRWSGGSPMRNFTSRSLNRQFDEIFFVNSVAQTS